MPFDSAGTFHRSRSWKSDAAAGVRIRADYHDDHDGDLAAGLSNCITKDGRSQPSANIPMNGNKIVNHGNTLASDPPDTVATKSYVDSVREFGSGVTITGANYPNGMVNFAATTGITGLSWANATMSWVGKVADPDKFPQRIAATDLPDGTGSELVTIDKTGVLGITRYITQNLSLTGSDWRVNKIGTGTRVDVNNASVTFAYNETATLSDNQIAPLKDFWSVNKTTMTHTSSGSSILELRKKDTGGPFSSRIRGMAAAEPRWDLELGDATTESGSAFVGSNYRITAYDNAGVNGKTMLTIDRSTDTATFRGDIVSTAGHFDTTASQVVLSGRGGGVYLRPNGPTNTTEQVYVDAVGDLYISQGNLRIDDANNAGAYLGRGQQGRNGITGSYQGTWHNWILSGGDIYALVGSTNYGAIQMQCDYRTKRDVAALPSTWDSVKRLHPIVYRRKEYLDSGPVDERLRWGFIAHELQETLVDTAATFRKDQENVIQGPDLQAVCAALTKALQEAMARIEALEARP